MMPDDPQEQRRQYDQARKVQAEATEHDSLRPVSAAEVPDAVEAASTQNEETEKKVNKHKARGADWVRPTNLLARSSSAMSGRGIDLQSKLAKRADRRVVTGVKYFVAKAKNLPPLSSFGRGRTHEPPTRSAVGRN